MKEIKREQEGTICSPQLEVIGITYVTRNILLQCENYTDCIALYIFYAHTSRWQKMSSAYATTPYVMRKLKWGRERVLNARKILLNLGLITECVQRAENGTIEKRYIHVNHISHPVELPPTIAIGYDNNPLGITTPSVYMGTPQLTQATKTHALSINKRNAKEINNISEEYKIINDFNSSSAASAENGKVQPIKRKRRVPIETNTEQPILNENTPKQKPLFEKPRLITEKDFDMFWQHYPKKAQRGKAVSAWYKLCNEKSKASVRPTLETVLKALNLQRKSQQWQDQTYIPYPTTWINQYRWLDDPNLMGVPKFEERTAKKSTIGHVGKAIEYRKADITM